MMVIRRLCLLFLVLFSSTIQAECPTQVECVNGICKNSPIPSCNSSNPARVYSPSQGSLPSGSLSSSELPAQSEVSNSADSSASNLVKGYPCAENGSCYGDVSNITGLPKTTHVDGYYRKDGTYVRGHYRSRR